MKLTFEAADIYDIFDQMKRVLQFDHRVAEPAPLNPAHGMGIQASKDQSGPGPEQFAKVQREVKEVLQKISETIPMDAVEAKLREPWPAPKAPPAKKPKRVRTEKQLANDEKMRVAALARIAAKRAAKAEQQSQSDPLAEPVAPPATAESLGLDPAEVVKVRQQTIEDLQQAYANGHQQEVFELLSRFGNGAKSFRELPPEAFMPIREAIDKGALT